MRFLDNFKGKSAKKIICPVLKLKNGCLRPLVLSDTEAIYYLRSNPEVFKYTPFSPYKKVKTAEHFVKSVIRDVNRGEGCFWGIEREGSIIGTICLWNFDAYNEKGEIGYELHPDFQKKGIMTEAIGKVLYFAETDLKLLKVDAITHQDNQASLALLKKFQFNYLGIAREVDPTLDEETDMLLYCKVI